MTPSEITRKINSLSSLRSRARAAGDQEKADLLTREIGRLRVQRTETRRSRKAALRNNDGPEALKELLRF